jgi:hypothetical protein
LFAPFQVSETRVRASPAAQPFEDFSSNSRCVTQGSLENPRLNRSFDARIQTLDAAARENLVGIRLAGYAWYTRWVMNHSYSIVDGPKIEGETVVLRVVVEHPEAEDSGPVFVCRLNNFDDMTVETYPKGQTPQAEGEYRAEAAQAAHTYIAENMGELEALFEELGRRQVASAPQ